ncbi:MULTISPECIES: hypothetical protein [unclassified Microcoleus]|uniref:hypothetical protein n=1 Tax=unclassified Microcoleus TaxID=2642155 RepID=UPI002FD2C080
MKRITLLKKGALVQKSDRLEIYLHNAGIVELEDSFYWYCGDPIPFPGEGTIPYTEGYTSTLDEAMRRLMSASAVMSPE